MSIASILAHPKLWKSMQMLTHLAKRGRTMQLGMGDRVIKKRLFINDIQLLLKVDSHSLTDGVPDAPTEPSVSELPLHLGTDAESPTRQPPRRRTIRRQSAPRRDDNAPLHDASEPGLTARFLFAGGTRL